MNDTTAKELDRLADWLRAQGMTPAQVLDCLKYIRQLKERNIPVFFEKENINTLDAKGEVLLTTPPTASAGK